MNKKINVTLLWFCSFLTLSSTTIFAGKNDVPGAIRTLPKKTITVGCNGHACAVVDGNRRLMYGMDEDALAILEMLLEDPTTKPNAKRLLTAIIGQINAESGAAKIHQHSGVTVDLLPKDKGSKGLHLQKDFFELTLKDTSYEAVFFEQFPPAGKITSDSGSVFENDNDFLPRAIEKARKALIVDGKMIIELALDAAFDAEFTTENLDQLRAKNPFMGYFDDIRADLYQALQSGGQTGRKSICEAIQFYVKNIKNKTKKTVNKISCLSGSMEKLIRPLLTNLLSGFVNLQGITEEDIYLRNINDRHDIVKTVSMLILVFEQRDMMIAYMKSHGFKNAKLEWLEADEHQFNKTAGWFLTATKDSTYQERVSETATSSTSVEQ